MSNTLENVNNSLFWNNKYLKNEFKWDLGSPTPIFKNWSQNIPDKSNVKICIPGCGRGHDALYLAKQGFQVYAIDFASEAINYLKNKSINLNVNLNMFCSDFFTLDKKFNAFFDYILEYTFYCAINPNKRSDYVNKCYNLLKDNGKIVSIMLPIDTEFYKGPPFKVNKQELKSNFINKFKIIKIAKSSFSIEKRSKIELYAEYEKK